MQQATTNLAACLQEHPTLNLADVAYTLQVGRAAFAHRRVLVCQDGQDACEALLSGDPRRVFTTRQEHRDRPVAFLFPGVGEQYVGLSRELYEQEPIFRQTVDRCCDLLKPLLGCNLWEVLCRDSALCLSGGQSWGSQDGQAQGAVPTGLPYSDGNIHQAARPSNRNGRGGQAGLDMRALLGRAKTSAPLERLKQTALAQPAVFVIEYALAQLLMQWGIQPQAMLGYSLGEYVAACLAGVFSLEDALKLVARRAQLIQQTEPGAMIAVALSEKSVQTYLDEQISLAAINGPSTCVLSGPVEAIERLEEQLTELGIIMRRVETTHAFHSSILEPLMEPLTALVNEIELHAPAIPCISNVTGTWLSGEQATDPTYWARHMCQTVRFADGIGHLLQDSEHVLLEVGPGQSLSAFARQHPACSNERLPQIVSTLPTVYERQSDTASLFSALGKLWLAGVTIDWEALYTGERRRRVPLPTYPFERQRCWIDAPAQGEQKPSRQARSGKIKEIADWFYLPVWEQAPLSLAQAPAWSMEEQSPWLIFLDDCGLGEQTARRLAQAGHSCVQVRVGAHFACQDAYHYTIRPGEQEDYSALCKALATSQLIPRSVLHCWSVTRDDCSGPTAFQQQQERGFYSLLALVKTLSAQVYEEPVQLMIVSNQMQAVTGQECIQPEKATLQAVCRVVPQEHLNFTCRSVDLALADAGTATIGRVVEQLVEECTSKSADLLVAYRGRQRWTQAYRPVSLGPVVPEALPFRQQGVYLITGGLGSVGLRLSEYLAKTVQAKLVISGRSGLPDRNEWADWLASHDEADSVSRKIRKVQALEALGAEVLVVKADTASSEQMREAVAQAIERFGALHGVIHAAGITTDEGFGLVQDIERGACELQFQPKVYGLYVLEQVLRGIDVDFCLLFSSISTVLGGLGFLGYAAANTFMDAYTDKHNQTEDTPWLCVSWDTWYKENVQDERVTTIAEFVLQPEEGLEAFTRVLAARDLSHIVNSTGDLHLRIQQWIRRGTLSEGMEAEQQGLSGQGSGAARPPLSTAYVPARDEYEQRIIDVWQQVLGIEQIGINDNFFELGGHSLIGTQLISRLRHSFQINLPLMTLFDAPTVAELAEAIKLILLEEIDQLDEEEVQRLV